MAAGIAAVGVAARRGEGVNLRVKIAALPIPSKQYDDADIKQIARKVNAFIDNVFNPGDLVATSLEFIDIAESGYGLNTGGVYVDANGFLKVVREQDVFAPSFGIRVQLRDVTVSTA